MSFNPADRTNEEDGSNFPALLAEARAEARAWERSDAEVARLARIPAGSPGFIDHPVRALDREGAAQLRAVRAIRHACNLPENTRRDATITLGDGRTVTALGWGREIVAEIEGRCVSRALIVADAVAVG